MSRGHSVLGIANEFLLRGTNGGHGLTPMHLQKLCYMAHGFTLALLNHSLTRDRIEAWDYGPVYPELYDALKAVGGAPVPALIHENNWAGSAAVKGRIVKADVDSKEDRLLDRVWSDYGKFDAFQLSALTHEDDSPWAKVYKPGTKNLVIPDRLIKDYFLDLTKG